MQILKPTCGLLSFFLLFTSTGLCEVYADSKTSNVPSWIKTYAKWWGEGIISDDDFITVTVWLIENNLLPETDIVGEPKDQINVESVKKTAILWSQGKVSDDNFFYAVEYLAKIRGPSFNVSPNEITMNELSDLSVWNDTKKSVVIVPIFTAAAYWEPGFYTYYRGECDSTCLTITLGGEKQFGYTSSHKAVSLLQRLGYHTITDIDVDKNPEILHKYDKVIVLHNEYVTQREFDAITSHPHVIYLYPNALYAKVNVNYDKNTITLVRGHNYPQSSIRNGFDWKYDHSPLEYDNQCASWNFYEIDKGIMLNCYPDNYLLHSFPLLKLVKDY